jgi:hypothetical protein
MAQALVVFGRARLGPSFCTSGFFPDWPEGCQVDTGTVMVETDEEEAGNYECHVECRSIGNNNNNGF